MSGGKSLPFAELKKKWQEKGPLKMCDNKKDEEARLIYQIYTEDIRHAKNQLWLIIYNGLLLQAAIFAILKLEKINIYSNYLKVILWVATGLVIILLIVYYYLLERFRNKKKKIYKEFFEREIREILETKDQCVDKFLGERSEFVFLLIFISILIIGAHLVSKTV